MSNESSSNSNTMIQGKIVLVTGANRGIGKALVEGFLQHGAEKVYAAVRRLDTANALVETHGKTKVVPIYIDLAKPESIQEAAQQTQDVDIVVNNAGVLTNDSNPLDPVSVKNLELELQVNVFGLLHMAQTYAPVLQKNDGTIFCQINSVASLRPAAPHVSTYSASKAAAYSLTQSLRMALSPTTDDSSKNRNVRVLSVHPGPIATDMIQQAGFGNAAEPPSQVAEAVVEAIETPGVFHVYPDSKSRALGRVFQEFAEKVIEPSIAYPES